MIGSEARDALRGERSHMLHEHQVLLQAGKRETEFVKSQMHSELESHNASNRRSLHEREVQQERICTKLGIPGAHLRVQLQTEELMMTSLKESFQGNSESERQAVISAQQFAISLQSEMSQATSACDSWKPEVIRLKTRRWRCKARRG